MKKLIITILCLALVCGGGYFGYKRYQKNKDEKRIVDVVPISFLSQSYWADEASLEGRVTTGSSQSVYLDSEKLVKKLNVNVGDEVKKGDVILTYDMTVVELETEQKKNQIAVIEQQILEEQRELTRIKNLIPSEYAPKDPVFPDYEEPEFPEFPEEPEEPQKPVRIIDRLLNLDQAAEMTEEGALVFQCGAETEVTSAFMGMLKTTNRRALLYVYDESLSVAYFWDISGMNLTDTDMVDWIVSDGVQFDGYAAFFDSDKAEAHGIFKGYDPTYTEPDIPDDGMFDEPEPDWDYYEPPMISGGEDFSENYMYSRAELDSMIKQKENEIKQCEIQLKSAKLNYENSLRRKKDGNVTAEIDGIVVKVGTDTDEENQWDTSNDYFDMFYGTGSSSGQNSDQAYIVIQGKEGLCIDIYVGELNLDKFEIGTVVNAMSWDTGENFSAEVIEVSEEPMKNYYVWNENPNSSIYAVKASVIDDVTIPVNYWVNVTMPQSEEASSGLYIPMHYTHRDGSGYYVMKDKDGVLCKQYLKTGKVIWGSYIEIKGGISYDDMICFPYGKDVKEGVKTRRTEKVLY